MTELLTSLSQKIEKRIAGITHGELFLDYLYENKEGKDPYGFGIHSPLGTGLTDRWAYLMMRFDNEKEPTPLRPEQTARLLAQRPFDEICALLQPQNVSTGPDVSIQWIAKNPYYLEHIKNAYCLKKYPSGALKLVPRYPHEIQPLIRHFHTRSG